MTERARFTLADLRRAEKVATEAGKQVVIDGGRILIVAGPPPQAQPPDAGFNRYDEVKW
jgi:hypothetical protein